MSVAYYNYLLEVYRRRELRKVERARIRDVCDPFSLPDCEFSKLWRVNKDMAHYLVDRLKVDFESSENSLPVHLKVLCAVQFFANGGYQRQIGQDHSVCHAQTTASKYIRQFTTSIYRRLLAEWVHFPATDITRRRIATGFEEKFVVPNILGLIDCTHVRITPPAGPQGAQYKNRRKDAHTINVQLIVDSDCRIISVNARYPGRVHDAFIWRYCAVRQEMKRLHDNHIGEYFLLGDSGYPLEPWLLTPIANAGQNSAEANYTNWHCRVRNAVERTNGYLKGSLRCLGGDRILHYAPEMCSEIIYACCIIYNLMKHFGVQLDEDEIQHEIHEESQDPVDSTPAGLLRIALNKREQIVSNYFRV